jgi:LmbE family N-acetylglucosaminyl deacetylase
MRFDDTLEIESAMVIFAHPDDAEWLCGGTTARWVSEGVAVTYVLVTNGASGETPKIEGMTRERLTQLRAQEQRRAAAVLGVTDIVMLGFEDGYLEPNVELRRAIAREVRRARPDVVLTMDPTIRIVEDLYLNHPDHIALGEVVLRAVNPDASSRLMFPELERDEGLAKHLPKAVFLSTFFSGQAYVDISSTFDRKLEALMCHASQIDDPDGFASFVREQYKGIGQKAGVEYAEAFRVIRTLQI